MEGINRIEKRKISEEVVNEIKRLIQDGVFTSNTKLPPEKELAEMFGVGRSSIREALSMLAAADIVETRQGEGSFVRKIDLTDYIHPLVLSMVAEKKQTLHLLETRRIVELGTVELAAIRANQSDFNEMKEALLDMEQQLKLGRTGMQADFAFHRAIAAASKNPVLIQVMENLSQLMKHSLEYTLRQNTGKYAERRKLVLQEHQDIFANLEKRDPKGAVSAMQIHLEKVRQKLLSLDQESES